VDDWLPLTEHVNPSTRDLDLLGTADLLHRINDEDRRAAWAVEREIGVIATAVDEIVARLRRGGRLHYFGAGTSGRIAAADAAEIPPTFSAEGVVVAHVAGGPSALALAVEAAEDDVAAGERDARELKDRDVAVLVSASGRAPYVLGALETAEKSGALTIGMTNSPGTPLATRPNVAVVLRTGAEVIAGSTRMKAAAAQKMALTMISTAVMIKLGKVYGNLMIDLQATNVKLRDRAERLTEMASGQTIAQVRAALAASDYRPKVALVMLHKGCDALQAQALLERAGGQLRRALENEAVRDGMT